MESPTTWLSTYRAMHLFFDLFHDSYCSKLHPLSSSSQPSINTLLLKQHQPSFLPRPSNRLNVNIQAHITLHFQRASPFNPVPLLTHQSVVNRIHTSFTPARFVGNILYCIEYRLRLWIGGTAFPVSRHRITLALT